MNLSFMEYTFKAAETAIYPNAGKDLTYPCLGLKGEIGEVCEHLKKTIRDDEGVFSEVRLRSLNKELGDVAWYMAALVRTLPGDESISVKLARPAGQGVTPSEHPELLPAIAQTDKLAYYATQCSPNVLADDRSIGSLVCVCYVHWRNVCLSLGFDPSTVLADNLVKLLDRKERGVIKGSGDER